MSSDYKALDFSQRVSDVADRAITPTRLMIGGALLTAFSAYASVTVGDISTVKDFAKAVISQPFNCFNIGLVTTAAGFITRNNNSRTPPSA